MRSSTMYVLHFAETLTGRLTPDAGKIPPIYCACGWSFAMDALSAEGVRRLSQLNVRALGINGRKRFERHFIADRLFRQIDGFYQQVSPNHPLRQAQAPS